VPQQLHDPYANQQANNPANPSGLQQDAKARQDSGLYDPYAPPGQSSDPGDPTTYTAKSWYTGQNREGTNNGWDSDFWARAMEANKAAGEAGKLNEQFQTPQFATGVVTWDHTATDGSGQDFHFGDIYDNGKKVGNVFHEFKNQPATANLMMADILFDAKTKAHIYADSDPTTALSSAVQQAHETNNVEVPKMLASKEFNENVDRRTGEIAEGKSQAAIVGGGALAGGTLAAGVTAVGGAWLGPLDAIPTSVAFLGGSAVGGVGAWLNRDTLDQQAARAAEITSMSFKENSTLAGVGTAVQQWSGFGGRLLSPISNVTQGVADLGHAGDGQSEFYRLDDKGDRTVSKWLQVADVGATVADSVLQFGSPVGRLLYTTQMAGTIGGEVTELAATGGKSFDYTRGGFDNIFRDDKGHVDLVSGAAGIGKVGIDAVQLGMVHGLAGKVDSGLRAAGEQTVYEGGLGAVGRFGNKLNMFRKGAANATGAEAGREFEHVGVRWTLDEAGNVTGKKATLALLAPSEQLGNVSARIIGMRMAAKRGGAYSADDFYRAARSMAQGDSRLTSIVVNAMGEGYEEGLQSVFDNLSHNQSISLSDIGTSALYGFAAGAGMGLGFQAHAVDPATQAYSQAAAAYEMRTGGAKLSRDEWNAMTEVQQRSLSALSAIETSSLKAAYKQASSDMAMRQTGSVVHIEKVHDAYQNKLAADLEHGTRRTDGAFAMIQLEDASWRGDAVGSSARQLAINLLNHGRGLAIQRDYLKAQVDEATKALATDPTNQDLIDKGARAQVLLDNTERVLVWSQRVNDDIEQRLQRIHADGVTPAEIVAEVRSMNQFLQDAFDRVDIEGVAEPMSDQDKLDLAKAVSLVFARDPHADSGSYHILVPQASEQLTLYSSDNVVQISHALLPALRGDYDGDKVRQLAQLVLDDASYANGRSGQNFVGAGEHVNVGAPKYEEFITDYMSEALTGRNQAIQKYASATLTQIGASIRRRYANVVDQVVLDRILRNFNDAVESNVKSARSALLDGLASEAGTQITEFAHGNLSNEWLWIDQLVRTSFQEFQGNYAANRPMISPQPNSDVVAPNQQSNEVRERRAARSATIGQEVGLITAGDTMFRKDQKLHYASQLASVLSADQAPTQERLSELAAIYEEWGQRLTRSALDDIRGKDDITTRVYAQLLALSESSAEQISAKLGYTVNASETLAVLANTAVTDWDYDSKGNIVGGKKTITLAQMLLKRSIAEDRVEKASILAVSPELQARYATLESMTRPGGSDHPVNAERAFVEVVGSQQMFALLGEAANVFGPQLTVEQFTRAYVGASEQTRYLMDSELRGEAEYLGRKRSKNIPYGLEEMRAGEITAYRAVVDSILAVGHHRLTIDKAGKLTGEFAERSDRISDSFQNAHERIVTALNKFIAISPRKHGETAAETVERMLDANPDFARKLLDLIPDAAVNSVYRVDEENNLHIANWVYDMFAISDSKHAEMYYWRNILRAEINYLGINQGKSEGSEGEASRNNIRLPRRIHRIVSALSSSPDKGLMLEQFIMQMEKSTDLSEFMRWVNMTPGVRGNQAPLTAWVDDVAEFDQDKAHGGWTTALDGAELREAISSLRVAADNLVSDLATEKASIASDFQVISAVERWLAHLDDPSVAVDAGDEELHRQFVLAIEHSNDYIVGVGSQQMLLQTIGAVRGLNAQSHTKGKTAENVRLNGMFDALRDARGYTVNYERLMAMMTSSNLDAVSGNMALLAKDGVRTMDDEGRTVEWTQPDAKQMIKLLKNADTRPLARAILFPQVLEANAAGYLSNQLLVGKDLKSLLNGNSHKELFPKNDRLSYDAAMRYLMLVESSASKFGGNLAHFGVQRAVNDLVIARTSAADHQLTNYEIEQLTRDAYYDFAVALQSASSLAMTPTTAGVDPLRAVHRLVGLQQRNMLVADNLGIKAEDRALLGPMIQDLLDTRAIQLEDAKREAAESIDPALAGDPATVAQLQKEHAALQADYDRFVERVDLLKSDGVAGRAISMFNIKKGEADQSAAKKDAIHSFIQSHLAWVDSMMASKKTLDKYTYQILDSARTGQPDLSDDEWAELSRAVIAVYITDATTMTAPGISTPPFPDVSTSQGVYDARYFDASFSYIADPLLDQTSPLIQAGMEIAARAGRTNTEVPQQVVEVLGRTLFKEHSLGSWTPDTARASMEANTRLDSAAAEPAISQAGVSPKLQATIAAAMRRSYTDPGEAYLSKTSLTWFNLTNGSDFDEVDVTMPDGTNNPTPRAMLNNRFARSVVATFVDPETGEVTQEDLFKYDQNLGVPFWSVEEASTTGYQAVHLSRIQRTVEFLADAKKVKPDSIGVMVEFFHPESQPSDGEFANNLFFEGTSFKLPGDSANGLLETLWFRPGGISPTAQAQALDASKLGMPALQNFTGPDKATVESIERTWADDFAGMLRAKARILTETDLGFGTLDPEYYNAHLKGLKIRHFVRGTDANGSPVLWSAEQVMEFQRNNPPDADGNRAPLPFNDAALWIPSDDVLRSMLGETGDQGVKRLFGDQLTPDITQVKRYRGVTPDMLGRFIKGVSGETKTLDETRIANRARQSMLTVRGQMSEAERNRFDARIKFYAEARIQSDLDRSEMMQRGTGGFDPSRNLQAAVARGEDALHAEDIAFDWIAAGIPFIGMRDPQETMLGRMMIQNVDAMLEADGFRTGWVYREGWSDAKMPEGQLNEHSLGNDRKGFRVSPGDIVVVELDSFSGNRETAKKRLDYLADRGAIIVLASPDGTGDMRAELSQYLEGHGLGYSRMAGSGHVMQPNTSVSRYANQRARVSTLTEMRGISKRSMVAILHVADKDIEENSAWVRPNNERLSAIGVSVDLIPSNFLYRFNVPVESYGNTSQVDKVAAHLKGLDDAAGQKLLKEQANGHLKGKQRQQADDDFDHAWTRLMARIDSNTGSLLPTPGEQFEIGDMIPLTDNHHNVVLYRHGYKAPKDDVIKKLTSIAMPDKADAHNIAVFPTDPEDAATVHTGTVVSVNPRSGYGLSMEMNIPFQQFGDKKVVEWNGMKYMLTPMGERIKLPDHGFFPGWGIDMIVSQHDTISKEAFDGIINNHRNAIAIFGADFLPDVAKVFKTSPANARALLYAIATGRDSLTIEAADELMTSSRFPAMISAMLKPVADASANLTTEDWVSEIADPQSPEAQITRALVLYLMTPGARVDDVLKSGGFNDNNATPDSQSILMPRLFTQVFDFAPHGSELRKEMNRRFNKQFNNSPFNPGEGYSLAEDFTLEIRMGTPAKSGVMSLNEAERLFTDRGMTVGVSTEAHMVDGVERPIVKLRVDKEGERWPMGHFWYDANDGEIISVDILDKWKKQGIARDLMRYAEALSTDSGYEMPRHSDVLSAEGAAFAAAVAPAKSTPGTGDTTKNLSGWLQIAEVHSSGDNPVKNGMAFSEMQDGAVSSHSAAIAYLATGAQTTYAGDLAKTRVFTEGKGLERFDEDVVDGGVWRLMNRLADADAGTRWRRDMPAEAARRHNGRDAMVQYRQEIPVDDINGWDQAGRNSYKAKRLQVVHALGLRDSYAPMVDFWVRQLLGQPSSMDADAEVSRGITQKNALLALDDMLANVKDGYLPTISGMVPLMHVNDLRIIFTENQNKLTPFALRTSLEAKSQIAKTWDDYVEISLGGALTSDNLFDSAFLLALDGHMHTYQAATESLLNLPVSMDSRISMFLLDPQTNDDYIQLRSSVSDVMNRLTRDPIVLDTTRATMGDLTGENWVSGPQTSKHAPTAVIAKRREAMRQWRKENGVPMPLDITVKDLRKNGQKFIDMSTNTNALARMLINLRVGTAMINPALWFSMGPEQWVRGTLDRAANLLVGHSTQGKLAMAEAKLSETGLGQYAEQFGITARYSPDQIKRAKEVYAVLGQRNDFKAMVYRDLMYLRPSMHGIGKVEKWLENYAKFGAKMQDPTWGMRSDTLARRYFEAVMDEVAFSPGEHNLTIDSLMDNLQMDPQWLQKNAPELHLAGTNAIAQFRSLKATPLSLALRGIYEPLSESTNSATSFLGTVLLKMPLLFSNYAFNVMTTITGMQGMSDFTAAVLHGRTNALKHPVTFWSRLQAKANGEEITPDDEANFDMSTVLEGVDLSRSFIRGGLTHTGLFMAGMMAGGLGLSGEDDETKKRRRMAKLQGAPFVYDPRAVENDFRNSDSIFLDSLPFGLGSYFQVGDPSAPGGVRSMAGLNWTLKQFVSPILGMERFYETGDFKQVTWGFQDAVGSFPLINTMMWSDAVETAHEFASMADDEAALGGPHNMVKAAALLTNGVGVYERMLFENSFVNQLYTSWDAYDRDPYKLPQTDSDGTIQKDIVGEPYGQDTALTPHVDPETGQLVMGYLGRSTASGTLHALTENRFTLATAMSLFTGLTGGQNDYYRKNMPVKTQEVPKTPSTKEEVEGLVRKISGDQGGQPLITEDEIRYALKGQAMRTKDWDLYNNLDKIAHEKYMEQKGAVEPLSVIDKAGREALTKAGARAVYWGIMKNSVTLDSPSLAGIYVPMTMRDEIAKEWTKELIQEGVDMGLDQTKATARMKRLWYGPTSDPSVQGLGDILFSKNISYQPMATYNQLNTTYVMGPDGRPWATGITRGNLMTALGIQPVKRLYTSEQGFPGQKGSTGTDSRLNTTDYINRINTGMRALELVDDSRYTPTDVEIGKSIEDAIKEAAKQQYTPYTPYQNKGTSGYSRSGYGHRSYGGGGGYASRGYPNYNKMYAPPHAIAPYGDSIPFINTTNPIIRRADVRRERVWSERGRLKQWQ
jgi:hypothetical protein